MTIQITTNEVLKDLEKWFRAHCDSDWEHSYGVSIETTDNPGWHVEIDLLETKWAESVLPFFREERSTSDWIQFQVSGGKFTGSGSIGNLVEILQRFLQLVEQAPQPSRASSVVTPTGGGDPV